MDLNYLDIIRMTQQYWRDEIENIKSPFCKLTKIENRVSGKFIRVGNVTKKILISIQNSINRKQKWYFTRKELSEYFDVSEESIKKSLRLITKNLNMIFLKLPSSYIKGGNPFEKKFNNYKYFIMPPKFSVEIIELYPNFDFGNYKFNALLKGDKRLSSIEEENLLFYELTIRNEYKIKDFVKKNGYYLNAAIFGVNNNYQNIGVNKQINILTIKQKETNECWNIPLIF